MKRINRVFRVVHIFPWTVYVGVILWDILAWGNKFFPNIYIAVLLTGLYVFYSHFFILSKYLNKRKFKEGQNRNIQKHVTKRIRGESNS